MSIQDWIGEFVADSNLLLPTYFITPRYAVTYKNEFEDPGCISIF